MLFSFTGMGAFSIAYDLIAKASERLSRSADEFKLRWEAIRYRAIAGGMVAAVLCVLLGNLGELGVLLDTWQKASTSQIDTGIGLVDNVAKTLDGGANIILGGQSAPIYPGDWFWTATRAININQGETAPITEFPYFTFLYGDLHAHMISMPLMFLALAWAISLVLRAKDGIGSWWEAGAIWVVGGIAIGVLRATNTWDFPTYLVIGGLAVVYFVYRRHENLLLPMWGQAGLAAAALAGLAVFDVLSVCGQLWTRICVAVVVGGVIHLFAELFGRLWAVFVLDSALHFG